MLDQISPEELGEHARQEWHKMGLRLSELVIAKAQWPEEPVSPDHQSTPDTPNWRPEQLLREIGYPD